MQTEQQKAESLKGEVKQGLKDMGVISDDMFESIFEGVFQKAVDEMIENKTFMERKNLSKRIFSVMEEVVGHDL